MKTDFGILGQIVALPSRGAFGVMKGDDGKTYYFENQVYEFKVKGLRREKMQKKMSYMKFNALMERSYLKEGDRVYARGINLFKNRNLKTECLRLDKFYKA